MDRLRTLITRDACEESDSIISSDFNWNDLSIGNDTNTCEKFFCKYFLALIFFVFFSKKINFRLLSAKNCI